MNILTRYACAFVLIFGQLISAITAAHAQNLRAQSGIIAATSGPVRVVSANIGKVAATGQKIYLNDIIETGTGGKMQIMLMDRTTMTIGPKTSIIIDEFVYDPGVERSLTATVLKGTFKLASPSLNIKNKQSRKLNLPNATVSIRGTELIGSVTAASQDIVLLNGAISVANDGFSQDIDRPNFGVNINNTGQISVPTFFSNEAMGELLEQLEATSEPEAAETDAEANDEEADGDDANTEDAGNDEAGNDEAGNDDAGNDQASVNEDDAGADGQTTETEAEGNAASVFTQASVDEGEAPTEAEVASAAEAVASGEADINDLRVLSRAGPASASAVAAILGVEIDEETGEITGNPEAVLGATFENIIESEGGTIDPELALTIPGVTLSETGEISFEGVTAEELVASNFNFAAGIDGPTFNNGDFEGDINTNFSANFGDEFEASFERAFDSSFETNFEQSFEGAFEVGFAPIDFNPEAFESLLEFTEFETDEIGFEFDFAFLDPENLSYFERDFEDLDGFNENNQPESLDEQVTNGLNDIVDSISSDTSSVLPDHTFMPTSNNYRSWNGSEWSVIAQNFNSGLVRFAHQGEASYASGGSCEDCTASTSTVVHIDFSSMKYQFIGNGEFYKPGYDPVEFSETTPEIALNYWELSSGTISRLPNERELESTFDDATNYTLTNSDDGSTISATIDMDFIYDAQLNDNSDVTSELGVFGSTRVEYTQTGESKVTLTAPEEAMTPQFD